EFQVWTRDSEINLDNSPILKEAKINWEDICFYKEATLSPQGYYTYSLFQAKRFANQLKDSAQVNRFWEKHVAPVLKNSPNEEQIQTLGYLTQGLLLAHTNREHKKAKTFIDRGCFEAKKIVADEKANTADVYAIPTAWMKVM